MGLIYATLGEHEAAVDQFIAATRLDNYLAVALVPPSSHSPVLPLILSSLTNPSYFQCGVSNFLIGRYDLSSKDFEEALLYLRGNQSMCVTPSVYHRFALLYSYHNSSSNYTQLGLAFTLFSAEVLFNKGRSLSNVFLVIPLNPCQVSL
jgi:neutrophil factor 2